MAYEWRRVYRRREGRCSGARVPKQGEATATGGAPDLLEYVGVSGLFLFTAKM